MLETKKTFIFFLIAFLLLPAAIGHTQHNTINLRPLRDSGLVEPVVVSPHRQPVRTHGSARDIRLPKNALLVMKTVQGTVEVEVVEDKKQYIMPYRIFMVDENNRLTASASGETRTISVTR